MNPSKRKPSSSGVTPRRDPQPDRVEDEEDWFDPEEFNASSTTAHAKAPSAEDDDDDDEAVGVAEEVSEFEDDDEAFETPSAKRKKRNGTAADGKSFLESLSDGLRNASETAHRFTTIGMARAGLEKLRYELRSAHALLGELAMRCWADAPDLGISAKDPAVVDAVKRVRLIRRAIREKQTKIAQLRKKE